MGNVLGNYCQRSLIAIQLISKTQLIVISDNKENFDCWWNWIKRGVFCMNRRYKCLFIGLKKTLESVGQDAESLPPSQWEFIGSDN